MTNIDAIVLSEGCCAGVVPANKPAASDALLAVAALPLDDAQLARAAMLDEEDVGELLRWFMSASRSAT